jgi:hypothetical protein
MGDLPHRVPNDPRFFTADVHITPDGRARVGGHDYTPAEYADMLRRSGYDGSKPVRLIGCDAGSNDFAKQLSKHLDAPVVAPTKPAWTDSHGRVFTSDAEIRPDGTRQPKIPPNGEWETHHPDGSKSKASDDGFAPGTHDKDKDLDPNDPNGAKDRAADDADADSDADSSADERPDHVDNDKKLTAWIYDGGRPSFSAETKHTVYSRTEMTKEGQFVCSTSGDPIPVKTKADGTPQFYELRGDPPRAYKTDPPEWYDKWKKEGIEPSPADLQPPHDKFPKPASNAAHMGHVDEAEYWRQVQFGIYHDISAEEFKKIYDHPDHYRLESKAANESHAHESESHGYGYYDKFVDMPHPERPDEPKFPPLPNAPEPDDIYKGRPKPGK